jgi:hypothetical protein
VIRCSDPQLSHRNGPNDQVKSGQGERSDNKIYCIGAAGIIFTAHPAGIGSAVEDGRRIFPRCRHRTAPSRWLIIDEMGDVQYMTSVVLGIPHGFVNH